MLALLDKVRTLDVSNINMQELDLLLAKVA